MATEIMHRLVLERKLMSPSTASRFGQELRCGSNQEKGPVRRTGGLRSSQDDTGGI